MTCPQHTSSYLTFVFLCFTQFSVLFFWLAMNQLTTAQMNGASFLKTSLVMTELNWSDATKHIFALLIPSLGETCLWSHLHTTLLIITCHLSFCFSSTSCICENYLIYLNTHQNTLLCLIKGENDFKSAFMWFFRCLVTSDAVCVVIGLKTWGSTTASGDGRLLSSVFSLLFHSCFCNDYKIKGCDKGTWAQAVQESFIATLWSGSWLLQLNGVT